MHREQRKTHFVAPQRTDTHSQMHFKHSCLTHTHTHTKEHRVSFHCLTKCPSSSHTSHTTHTNNFLRKHTQIQIKKKVNASAHGRKQSFDTMTLYLCLSDRVPCLSLCLELSSLLGSPHKTQLGLCSSAYHFTFYPLSFFSTHLSLPLSLSHCHDDILL